MSVNLTVYLFLFSFSSLAQTAFLKEYHSTDDVRMFDILEWNEKMISCGFLDRMDQNKYLGVLTFIDMNGQLENNVYFEEDSSHILFRKMLKVSDGIVVHGLTTLDLDYTYRNTIWKLDFDGNVIWEKQFGQYSVVARDNTGWTILLGQSPNEFYVFSSEYGGSSSTDAEVSKFDINGNLLWTKLFGNDVSIITNDYCHEAAKLEDGFLVSMISTGQIASQLEEWIIKIDFDGNELWRKNCTNYLIASLDVPNTVNTLKAITTDEKNRLFAIFQSIEGEVFGKNRATSVVEFLPSGEFVSSIAILQDHYPNEDVEKATFSNNSISIFGQGADPGKTDPLHDLFLAKVSLVSKQLDFFKYYGFTPDSTGVLFGHASENSDGGYYIGGKRFRLQPYGNNYVLAKTDCRGNIDWDKRLCGFQSEEDMVIFPNPITDFLTIQFSNIDEGESITLQLFDKTGRLVKSEKFENLKLVHWDLSEISNGLYSIKAEFTNSSKLFKKIIKY